MYFAPANPAMNPCPAPYTAVPKVGIFRADNCLIALIPSKVTGILLPNLGFFL